RGGRARHRGPRHGGCSHRRPTRDGHRGVRSPAPAVATLEAERDRLTADVEGAAAARVRLEEALAGALEEARARDQVLTGQLEVRTRESEALRSEHAAGVAATNARLETIINECDQR